MEKMEETLDPVRKIIREQMDKMWREGYTAGAVTTCAILYRTFLGAGLDRSNVLFSILENMAKKEGCEDLSAYAENMKANNTH